MDDCMSRDSAQSGTPRQLTPPYWTHCIPCQISTPEPIQSPGKSKRPDGGGGKDGRMVERIDKQKSPCVLQDFVPFGAAAQKASKMLVFPLFNSC